jgi:hypothetical protein
MPSVVTPALVDRGRVSGRVVSAAEVQVLFLAVTPGAAPATAASPATASARRESIKHYERHVLAWYALGRVDEARSARAAIAPQRPAGTRSQPRVD